MRRKGGCAQNAQIGSEPLERLRTDPGRTQLMDEVLFPLLQRLQPSERICAVPVTHGLFSTPRVTRRTTAAFICGAAVTP